MRRIIGLTLVLIAIFLIEGCKRNTVKRDPIRVIDERDLLLEMVRNEPVDGDEQKLPASMLDWPVMTTPPKDGQDNVNLDEGAQKAKDLRAKQKRWNNTMSLGKAYIAFCNKIPAKEHSVQTFKSHVRRTEGDALRAELDGEKFYIGFLSVVTHPHQILVYCKSADEDGSYPAFKTDAAGLPPAKVVSVKDTEVELMLKDQELRALLWKFWDFASSHYITMPADPREANEMKGLLNQAPSTALTAVAQRFPKYIKNQPDVRTSKKFKKYAFDNFGPAYREAFEGTKFRVNMGGNLRDANEIVIAHGSLDRTKDEGEYQKVVLANGTIKKEQPNIVNQKIVDVP